MQNDAIFFKHANLSHQKDILRWLAEPHVREFWDNSPEHQQDILLFMEGRVKLSPYFKGIFDYWIGSLRDEPYCLLMTSEVLPDLSNLPKQWIPHLSKTGRTFTIDFMIGDKKYLGKGLGGFTLDAFTQFIHNQDPSIDTFFIDPSAHNPRAQRVYEKGGFKTIDTFYWEDFSEEKHYLMVKRIPL
jgi:RimJ/RimL family protein N-acetyltransferase